MGANRSEHKTYYSISYGKFVQKVDDKTPLAVKRTTKNNVVVYELIFDSIEGVIEDVRFFKDDEFGNKWNVSIRDKILHVAQLHEETKYCLRFLEIFPNIKKGDYVKLTPYDFEHNGLRKVGLSITGGIDYKKLPSHYHSFKDIGKEKMECEYLNGYPKYEGKSGDKEEWKIYCIKRNKFLREKSLDYLGFGFGIIREIEQTPDEPTTEKDNSDLPF